MAGPHPILEVESARQSNQGCQAVAQKADLDRSSRAVARTSLTNYATRYPRHADQFSGCLQGDKQAEFVRLEQPPVATGDLNPVKVRPKPQLAVEFSAELLFAAWRATAVRAETWQLQKAQGAQV
jgi:hypothetical protein